MGRDAGTDDQTPEPGRSGGAGGFWAYRGLGLPRTPGEVRSRDLTVLAIVGLTIFGYVSIAPNARLDPGRTAMHKTDFTVFAEAAAAFFDGRDPYRVTSPRGWFYLYPPLFALLIAPLRVFDLRSQVVIWYAWDVALSFACLGEARRLWRLVGGPAAGVHLRRWVVLGGALATVLPALDCMQAGQLGITILYLLMVGFRLNVQGRSGWSRFAGGIILALPAVIKLVPTFPVAFLLGQRWSAVAFGRPGGRPWGHASAVTAGVLAGAFLFVLAVPAGIVGWGRNLDFLRVWYGRVVTDDKLGPNANFNVHSFRNQSLANAVYLLDKAIRPAPAIPGMRYVPDRPEMATHPEVRVFLGLAALLLAAVGATTGRRDDALDQATAFGLAGCATLLISPLAWGHYYMAWLPAQLCVPLWLERRGRPRAARAFAALPALLIWAHYVPMHTTGPLGLLGLGTAAWCLAACGLILGPEIGAARRGRPARATVGASALPGPHGRSPRATRAHAPDSPHLPIVTRRAR